LFLVSTIRTASPERLNLFLQFSQSASRPALGPTQPPIQWVRGALSLGVKRPEGEADHSPPSSAEVKNAWCYTSTPQCLHGVVKLYLYIYLYRERTVTQLSLTPRSPVLLENNLSLTSPTFPIVVTLSVYAYFVLSSYSERIKER
jgi:hypothetical protein